ncbi:MAG: ROK family protein [Bacteroidota bacterium]
MNTDIRFGLDLGGTKIEGVVLDKDGHVKTRQRIPTGRKHGYAHILDQIVKMVGLLEVEVDQKASRVGIGTPGTTDPKTGLMKNANTTVLNNKALDDDLMLRLDKEVILANDANCFAVAETRLGVVKDTCPDAQLVFGVIMGTGVGGGMVINGKPWNGGQGIAGEWGHAYLDHSGGQCYCGKIGCVETLISGPALERYYAARSGQNLGLKEIVSRYRSDSDRHAVATILRLLHFFGKGIANIINTIDPDAIVLGGGLGQIEELYSRGVEHVKKHVFNPGLNTPILKPTLGDSAGVFGAAML